METLAEERVALPPMLKAMWLRRVQLPLELPATTIMTTGISPDS